MDTEPFPTPFAGYEGAVRPEWIDSNGHMNLAYYIVLFDGAADLLFDALRYGAEDRKLSNQGPFAVESHTLYEQELLAGERVRVAAQILSADAKRIHVAYEMTRASDGARAACQEVMYLNVDLASRRTAAFAPDAQARMAMALAAHSALPRPDWVGRHVGARRRTP